MSNFSATRSRCPMLSGAGKKFKLSLEFLRPRSGDIVSRDYFNRNLDAFLDDPKMVTLRRNRLQQILVGDWLTVKGFGASMFLGVFCPTFHYPLVVAAFQQFSAGFTLGFLLARCCLQQFTRFCQRIRWVTCLRWVLYYITWIQVPAQCIMVIKPRLQ